MRPSVILFTFATAAVSLPLLGLDKIVPELGLDKVVHEVGQLGGGGGLVNVAPNVSPKVGLSNDNSCTGIGVSACDPINVNGTQGSNNNNSNPGKTTSAPAPASSGQSGSGSGGGGLINLAPVISPMSTCPTTTAVLASAFPSAIPLMSEEHRTPTTLDEV
ncbi:hypothetical protein PG995_003486 [Apiospora arundinis]